MHKMCGAAEFQEIGSIGGEQQKRRFRPPWQHEQIHRVLWMPHAAPKTDTQCSLLTDAERTIPF